jgi:hypothetical protein
MRLRIRFVLSAALLTLSALHARAADEVTDKIDWPRFLSRSDMLWKKVPTKWNEGAFMGNGLLGANVFATDDGHGIRWRIGRTDVVYQGNRIPIGEMVLKTVGKITGAELQLSLWNAELTGDIHTDRGVIDIQSFTHARDMIQIVELRPDAGESAASWEWQPGLAVNPRTIFQKSAVSENEKNPDPRASKAEDDVKLSIQPLKNDMEDATAWKEISRRLGPSPLSERRLGKNRRWRQRSNQGRKRRGRQTNSRPYALSSGVLAPLLARELRFHSRRANGILLLDSNV